MRELVYSNFIGKYKIEIYKDLFIPEVQYWNKSEVYLWHISGLNISGRKEKIEDAFAEIQNCLDFEIKQLQQQLVCLEFLNDAIESHTK